MVIGRALLWEKRRRWPSRLQTGLQLLGRTWRKLDDKTSKSVRCDLWGECALGVDKTVGQLHMLTINRGTWRSDVCFTLCTITMCILVQNESNIYWNHFSLSCQNNLQIITIRSSFSNIIPLILQLGPCILKLRRNKTNEIHIQSKVKHILRISMLLLHVLALYERHLQGAQRILMKLCICYFISAKI
jgi:hypothetical protein